MREYCVLCKRLRDMNDLTFVRIDTKYGPEIRYCCKEHYNKEKKCTVNIAEKQKTYTS